MIIVTIVTFSQEWKTKSPMNFSRTNACADTCNGLIFVFGGTNSNGPIAETEIYNPNTNTWTIAASIPTLRGEAACGNVKGKIYVIGGYNQNLGGKLNTVEEYDPQTNTWSTKAQMPTSRSTLSATVINDKIYVVGDWPNATGKLEIYDPKTDSWTVGSNSITGRMNENSATTVGGKMYFIGGKVYGSSGNNNSIISNKNEVYDPNSNTWISKASTPVSTCYATIAVLNNQIHYFGGTVGYQPIVYSNNHYIYDVLTDTWSIGLPLTSERNASCSVVLKNKIYVFGGSTLTTTLNLTEEYSICSNPSAIINPQGNTTFCDGGNVLLNSNTGLNYSYQWYNNSQIINGANTSSYQATSSGSFTVKVVDGNCNSTSSAVSVIVNPNPNVILNSINPVTYKNTSPIQLAGSPSGGVYLGNGVSGSTFVPAISSLGKRKIQYNYVTPQGCSGSSSITTIVVDTIGSVCSTYDTLKIKVNFTAGININKENTIRIFPNPTSSDLIIDNGNFTLMTGYKVTITDMLGKQVFNSLIDKQKFIINLSSLGSKGIYNVHLVDVNNTPIQTKQIVLE